MSYPVPPPPIAATPPASPSGRPPVVTVATALLWLMAGVGLIYAIATLAVVPGTVSRFRDVTGGSAVQRFTGENDPEYYVAVVWLGAAIALALAVIAFALFVVVGLSLRRGSNVARIATLVICVLGIAGGTAGVLTLAAQRSGETEPSSLGARLSEAYPDGWIGTNAGLAIAQILGYALVGILILTAPRAFFRRPAAPSAPQPAYGVSADGRQPVGAFPGNFPAPSSYPGTGYPAPAGSPGQPTGYAAPTGYPAGPVPGNPGFPGGGPPPGSGPYGPGAAPGYGPGGGAFAPGYGPGGGAFAPGAAPGYGPGSGAFAPGYGPGGDAFGSGAGSNAAPRDPAQPWSAPPDNSPYARPVGHAPDAAFAPPAPTQPAPAQYPPADPHSPYARPTPDTAVKPLAPADDSPTDQEPGAEPRTRPLEGAEVEAPGFSPADTREAKPPTPS